MTALSGMNEIEKYTRRSAATILALVRDYDFPATKIRGTWESDTELIDTWRREQIQKAKAPQPQAAGGK